MLKPIIFISHIHQDESIANALEGVISDALLGSFVIFNASKSIPPAVPWCELIIERLRSCEVLLVIATPDSIASPWVNFETGGAWVGGARVITCCAEGMTPYRLPDQLRHLQVLDLYSPDGLQTLIELLASMVGLDAPSKCNYAEAVSTIEKSWLTSQQSYEEDLADLYRDKVDDSLKSFQRGCIAWGSNLTLQSCPSLHHGWLPSEIQIQHDTSQHVLPKDLDQLYEEYLANDFPRKFSYDATRLMLVENPRSFSDLRTLRIQVKQTKWSQVQFCNGLFKDNPQKYIGKFLKGHIDLANTFVLHLVVATSDHYVLLTHTSPKVDYYPDRWACSIGEQLDPKDLSGQEGSSVQNWVERALFEELGVTTDGFKPANMRFMAAYLEGDIGNFGICGVVVLNYNRDTLDAIIDKHPRIDYEFQDWDFITWDDIPKELIIPKRSYHPTTGIRMFYAGLFKFGVHELNHRLFTLQKERKK